MNESNSSSVVDFVRKNLVVVTLSVMGVITMVAGILPYFKSEEPKIEIIKADEEQESQSIIMVDVSGAVENPGVYELPQGARVGNALSQAGGLAAQADRGWVSRYVNLASQVSDGMKIYIPEMGEGNVSQIGEVEGIGHTSLGGVNINTASSSELDALWGIGESRANDIISNRPYQEVEELMTKAGIPKNVFEKIKDKVSVY